MKKHPCVGDGSSRADLSDSTKPSDNLMEKHPVKRTALLAAICLSLCGSALGGARAVHPDKAYPKFQIGVSGIWATIEPGLKVTVAEAQAGTPAEEKVLKGDVIVNACGRDIKGPDPRVPLGLALGDAEAAGGKFRLTILRGGVSKQVVIDIPALGPYSKTWPLQCGKSAAIVQQTVRKLIKGQGDDGWFAPDGKKMGGGLTGCMAALFLLSTGEDAYLPNVEKFAHALAAQAEQSPTGSAWHAGYQLILLGEYYLRTGDKKVLRAMGVLSDKALKGQIADSWGHSIAKNTSVGYVQSGQMNSAGVTLFLGLCIARECGVKEAELPFQRAMVFFYRMLGHGSICYGDHRAEIYIDTNGRNSAMGCAMSLLDGEVYQMGARHMAMIVADSYCEPEAGHTGGGFNVIWRGIVTVLLGKDQQARYRRHMEGMKWYYDLCRRPGGSFKILPSPATRYSGDDWGYQMGLTYTAPLRTLRITGGPRTKYSVAVKPLPKLPWGATRDKEFLRCDYCEGYGREDETPDVIYAKLTGKEPVSVEYAARQMRHYSPMFRTWAAYKLAANQNDRAYEEIVKALNDPDVRVRRAGCDAISGYTNWGRGKFGRIPREVVTAQCMGAIEKMLADPKAAWWEIDGALWALGCAKPESIRKNWTSIAKYARHPEWYLRESAYWAVVGLGSEVKPEEVLFLADMFANSKHVFERSSYDGGMGQLVRAAQGSFGEKLDRQYAGRISRVLNNSNIARGYEPAAAHNEATFRTMMVLKRFKNPPYKLLIAEFVKYLKTWTPDYQHSCWMITGSKWQSGLCEVSMMLGKDARPIVEALRQCLNRMNTAARKWGGQAEQCRKALEETLAEWEGKYGRK